MEKLDRQAAKLKGSTTYFTGSACKHGHTAERYVKNGACIVCVKHANGQRHDPSLDVRKQTVAQLVQVKIRLHRVDLEVFKAAAYAMALARFPVLLMGDVYPGYLPMDCDSLTGLYKFNCHPSDIEQMQEIAKALRATHPAAFTVPEFSRYVQVDPVPDWADKP